jgi:N-acetylneuraminic acid mutarotase
MIRNCIQKLFFTFLLFNVYQVNCQTWEEVQSFPGTARDDGSSFSIDNKHYCGLGMDAGFSCTRDFYYYDGASTNWNNSTALPIGQERQYAVGCSWNGKGYIFGGLACDGTFLNDLWIFDPSSSTWSSGLPLPSDGRSGAEHFILADTLYIVGGKNTNGIISEVWAYDFTNNTWIQKTDLPGDGIWRGLSFEWNNLGYAGLGKNNLNSQTEFNADIYAYDPISDTWSLQVNPGISQRSYIGSAQVDSLVLIYGGLEPSNAILSSLDRLDISSWSLTSLPDFPDDARKGVTAFLNNNDFYISCGVSQIMRLNETWKIADILAIEKTVKEDFSMSPNPCDNVLKIQLSTQTDIPLTICSIEGKIVKTIYLNGSSSEEINVSDLKSGSYFVHFNSSVLKLEVLH